MARESGGRWTIVALGHWVIERGRSALHGFDFLGATALGVVRLLRGRTRHPAVHFGAAAQEAGVETLPVVALFALASGAVLTLLAAQQLDKLGVPALAPRLVGIVVLREIGALMVGIAVAGRVASAYAAEVALSVASGEAKAMRESGREPVDVLVAPRVLALTLMAPLLVAYANGLAVVGGLAVGPGLAGVGAREHLASTLSALTVKHAVAGLVKGMVFGFVAAAAGCFHGLHSGTSAAAVGRAVRKAVVSAVVAVALADLVLTFVFKWVRL
jgi:phospholipid/cholesterol/gamma-HCH transport system permease protein